MFFPTRPTEAPGSPVSEVVLQTCCSHRKDSVVCEMSATDCHMIWIDGVGSWQLCTGSTFSIGSPAQEDPSADISLLANISRQHAVLRYSDGQWQVTSGHPTAVSGKTVSGSAGIRSGDRLTLADRVQLGFRIPSVLSSSAVIDFESNHRPAHTVDGIILMVDHCLLGPGRDHHVWCPDWPDVIVLYRRNEQLWCRCAFPVRISGKIVSEPAVLTDGAVVEAEDLRFRIEQIR